MRRLRVGVLGATGLVGQRLLERLADHPWFEPAVLAASARSAGRPYAEAVSWALAGEPPATAATLVVAPCDAEAVSSCDLVLSALDSAQAMDLEPAIAAIGVPVISNSSAHRMNPAVPLLVPEVNAGHLAAFPVSNRAAHVANPNCAVIGLALALAPIERSFGVRRVVVTTMQALSGAGMSGPRALDLVDNVVPYIAGEEDKFERELGKILGRPRGDGRGIEAAHLSVSASCHRVAVSDGHLASVSVETAAPCDAESLLDAMRAFESPAEVRELPSAPQRPLVVRDAADRPQPRLDRDEGAGMSVVVGRVRPCPVLGVKFEVLSHNAVRGAAGGTLLVAELLVRRELIGPR